MSNLVPLRLQIAPLDPGFIGTPQDISDAIEANATIVTDQAYSLFVVGPTAPTSDEGPWFLNGITPWVWDVVTGAYIPAVLDQKSLRYGFFQDISLPADNTDYDVIYQLKSSSVPVGEPSGLLTWYNGAWKDVYAGIFGGYYTKTEIDTNIYTKVQADAAIATAVGTGPDVYQFRVSKNNAVQTITNGSGASQVTFNNEEYNIGVSYTPPWTPASNVYIAPVAGYYSFTASAAFVLASGSPTAITANLYLRHNGTTCQWVIRNTATPLNVVLQGATELHLGVGDMVDVGAEVTSAGASTWSIVNSPSQTNFFGHLIKAD